jgi:alkylation response protein AidB-like acyl-CoA dehydrogenase
MINKEVVSLSTKEFLNNLKNFFDKYFGDDAQKKIDLMEYLPEDKWLEIKKQGLLAPFLPAEYGGRTPSQKELLDVLRLAGHYGVPVTLRTGIEGALVIQPLTKYAKKELIEKVLPFIFEGEGGGLAITEPDSSGSAIAKEMLSYYEFLENGNIYIKAKKYWQGNSQSDFLLVAAKEKKGEKIEKSINLLFVPRKNIKFTPVRSEGLKAVRYAVNEIEGEIPAENLILLSEIPRKNLREFQDLFIRSRLQFIGMTHGIIENVHNNVTKYIRNKFDFIIHELNEIDSRKAVSKVLYDFVCKAVSPDKPVNDKLMEANIVKAVASEYAYEAARTAQKLMGAKGYEAGHPISNIALDIRPFTIFEGPNDMLFAEVFDQFSKANIEEKNNGITLNKSMTLYERFISDSRFVFANGKESLKTVSENIYNFINIYKLNDINPVKKVFDGKILSKLFVLGRLHNDTHTEKFLVREINKDILDFNY